jgi:hypothetical protein
LENADGHRLLADSWGRADNPLQGFCVVAFQRLEFYSGLRRHLEPCWRSVLMDEYKVVFDLCATPEIDDLEIGASFSGINTLYGGRKLGYLKLELRDT